MVKSPYASRITGTGSAFPQSTLTNVELARTLGTDERWIQERTGVVERRISRRGNKDEFNSSLGLAAARLALQMAGRSPEEIDLIYYATCTPDTLVPSTACWLQKGLGAQNAAALDVNAACAGFLFGLSIADQNVRTGFAKTVLVVGGEVLSAFVNWEDRGSCILFGDGAGAVLLERTESNETRRILSTHVGSDGTLWDLLHIPAGGSNVELTPDQFAAKEGKMRMKGRELFKEAVRTLAEYAEIALSANGLKAQEIDWFIPHQANLRIIEAVAKRLDFPMSKVIVNLDRVGNTSSATVPTALDGAIRDGRIKPGDLILLDAFGGGITYASALLRF